MVKEIVPDCRVEYAPTRGPDMRSYRVDCDKIAPQAARFQAAVDGAPRRRAALRSVQAERPDARRIRGRAVQAHRARQEADPRGQLLDDLRCNGAGAIEALSGQEDDDEHECEDEFGTKHAAPADAKTRDVPRSRQYAAGRRLLRRGPRQPEPRFPLDVAFCARLRARADHRDGDRRKSCSPTTTPITRRSRRRCWSTRATTSLDLIERRKLGPDSLVVELASNDGYLLKNSSRRGIPVLGIDPRRRPGEARAKRRRADAHARSSPSTWPRSCGPRARGPTSSTPTTCWRMSPTRTASSPASPRSEGRRRRRHRAPTSGPDRPLRVRHDLPRAPVLLLGHGARPLFAATACISTRSSGSPSTAVRCGSYVEPREPSEPPSRTCWPRSGATGSTRSPIIRDFSAGSTALKLDLSALLDEAEGRGRVDRRLRRRGQGRDADQHVGIGRELVDFVVDRNVHKQGRYMPGDHLPIRPAKRCSRTSRTTCCCLPGTSPTRSSSSRQEYRARGGKFIVRSRRRGSCNDGEADP